VIPFFFSLETSGSRQPSNLSTSVILFFGRWIGNQCLLLAPSLAGEAATATFLPVGLVRGVLGLAV